MYKYFSFRIVLFLFIPIVLTLGGCANLPKPDADTLNQPQSENTSAATNDSIDYGILPAINSSAQSERRAAWMNDGNLWHYIAARFTLPIPNNARIQTQLAFYASHVDYLQRVTERASPYLHMIVKDLQENDLPLELALLPIVESAYRPEAVSTSNATGIWQFIPSTGTHFGLQRTTWYDGRRDIKASTEAAVQYFSRLRVMFNDDWPVIIASYNGGEGTLQKAIDYNQSKGLPTDFWSLTKISQETADYPARLYALIIIFSNPEKFGFNPYPVPNASVLTEIKLNKPINLSKLATLTGVSHEELYRLNPGFDKLITGPASANLLVPKGLADQFTPSAMEAAEKSAIDWGRYTLRRGDNFHKVAYRYGCDADELIKVNRLSSAYARPGETILVPLGRGEKARLASGADRMYTVQSGDSLWGLARRFNMELADLQRMNGLKKKEEIKPGQKLMVASAGREPEPAHAARAVLKTPRDPHQAKPAAHKTKSRGANHYTVKKGDTLWNVAQRFSTTVTEIASANRIQTNRALKPGQVLVIASQ